MMTKEDLQKEQQVKKIFRHQRIKVIFGNIKNIVLVASVLISLLILFSDLLYNNIFITFILKLLAILNIYAFTSVNTNKLLKY